MSSSNIKIKREATSCIGMMHKQLGTTFKALSMTLSPSQEQRDALEACFNAHPYDPSMKNYAWPRLSIATRVASSGGDAPLVLEVPRVDFFALLPEDCLSNMVSTLSEICGQCLYIRRSSLSPPFL
jgi:hypothetical protein